MRLNDWDWRLDQERACRLFDFETRMIGCEGTPWYKDTDSVKRMVNKIYGAEAFGIKEDKSMNIAQDVRDQQNKDNMRRVIMNNLKIGDKICTSSNLTTPLEIAAFDYKYCRIQVKTHISGEGYDKFSRFWVDPLTVTDPAFRNKVSYTDYYKTPNRIPTPTKIIVNEDSKVTVVMWDDNTKTIVKCSEADQYDPYAAYCAAFAKKCYGTNSQLKKTIENLTVVQESKKKKESSVNGYEALLTRFNKEV